MIFTNKPELLEIANHLYRKQHGTDASPFDLLAQTERDHFIIQAEKFLLDNQTDYKLN